MNYYISLTASDLPPLLDLYKQLDADDDVCPKDQSEEAWNLHTEHYERQSGDLLYRKCGYR